MVKVRDILMGMRVGDPLFHQSRRYHRDIVKTKIAKVTIFLIVTEDGIEFDRTSGVKLDAGAPREIMMVNEDDGDWLIDFYTSPRYAWRQRSI